MCVPTHVVLQALPMHLPTHACLHACKPCCIIIGGTASLAAVVEARNYGGRSGSCPGLVVGPSRDSLSEIAGCAACTPMWSLATINHPRVCPACRCLMARASSTWSHLVAEHPQPDGTRPCSTHKVGSVQGCPVAGYPLLVNPD
jgi:hypothetical protein